MSGVSVTFWMAIDDVFRLQGGRTVFVGAVRSSHRHVPAMTCELLLDGRVIQSLRLEGEMLPEKRHPEPRRSVSTLDSVHVDRQLLTPGRFELRCK